MIIAIWGNAGSGKSTFALKLALGLADKKKNTVLIDSDYNAPQMNVWYPRKNFDVDASLARLLDNAIDVEAVASKIQVINKNFGILGYTKDFASASMPKRSDTTNDMFAALNKISDFVIVDCQSAPVNDIITFEAVSDAKKVFLSMTPDIKALSWYDTNVRMFESSWEQQEGKEIIRVFNKAHDYSPLDNIESIVGRVEYCLPFNMEVEEQMYTGTLENSLSHTGKLYGRIINTIVSDLTAEKELSKGR